MFWGDGHDLFDANNIYTTLSEFIELYTYTLCLNKLFRLYPGLWLSESL